MIVAGFGFRTAATAQSLADALERSGGSGRVRVLATVADKADTRLFACFAETLALPVHPVETDTLTQQEIQTFSVSSNIARGTGSVAEAAALAAAGPGARLIEPRVVSNDGMATCALAEGEAA